MQYVVMHKKKAESDLFVTEDDEEEVNPLTREMYNNLLE